MAGTATVMAARAGLRTRSSHSRVDLAPRRRGGPCSQPRTHPSRWSTPLGECRMPRPPLGPSSARHRDRCRARELLARRPRRRTYERSRNGLVISRSILGKSAGRRRPPLLSGRGSRRVAPVAVVPARSACPPKTSGWASAAPRAPNAKCIQPPKRKRVPATRMLWLPCSSSSISRISLTPSRSACRKPTFEWQLMAKLVS